MNDDIDKQLPLDFNAAPNHFPTESATKSVKSNLRLIYSAPQHSVINNSTSNIFFNKHEEKLFESIIAHSRSLSW